jgi:hypothetical protein
LGTLTVVEQGYTATLLNSGKVLLAGGSVLGQTVNSAELLDAESGNLMATAGLITERTGHAATLLNDGRVLVTGGVDSHGNALATAELYK